MRTLSGGEDRKNPETSLPLSCRLIREEEEEEEEEEGSTFYLIAWRWAQLSSKVSFLLPSFFFPPHLFSSFSPSPHAPPSSFSLLPLCARHPRHSRISSSSRRRRRRRRRRKKRKRRRHLFFGSRAKRRSGKCPLRLLYLVLIYRHTSIGI